MRFYNFNIHTLGPLRLDPHQFAAAAGTHGVRSDDEEVGRVAEI
jgi:hypothetical protein